MRTHIFMHTKITLVPSKEHKCKNRVSFLVQTEVKSSEAPHWAWEFFPYLLQSLQPRMATVMSLGSRSNLLLPFFRFLLPVSPPTPVSILSLLNSP